MVQTVGGQKWGKMQCGVFGRMIENTRALRTRVGMSGVQRVRLVANGRARHPIVAAKFVGIGTVIFVHPLFFVLNEPYPRLVRSELSVEVGGRWSPTTQHFISVGVRSRLGVCVGVPCLAQQPALWQTFFWSSQVLSKPTEALPHMRLSETSCLRGWRFEADMFVSRAAHQGHSTDFLGCSSVWVS